MQVLMKLRGLAAVSSALLMLIFLGFTWLPLHGSIPRRPIPTRGRFHPSYKGENSSNGSTLTVSQTLANNSATAHNLRNNFFMGNYNCSDDICFQFLKSAGTNRCEAKFGIVLNIETLHRNNGSCHFMNGSHRAPVGLISLPGSGSTWVRGLLEQATGICTGSVYCDVVLKDWFAGEGFQSGVVLAVKDHNPYIVWKNKLHPGGTGPPWGAVILIIRNPLDAMVAEWNRRKTRSHVATVGTDYYGADEAWGKYLNKSIITWKQYFVSLIRNGIQRNRLFLIIRYEDIKSDVFSEVKKMINFLNVPISDQLLKIRMSTGYEKFHRSQPQEFKHYTPEQKLQVVAVVKEVVDMLQKVNNNTFGITDYIV